MIKMYLKTFLIDTRCFLFLILIAKLCNNLVDHCIIIMPIYNVVILTYTMIDPIPNADTLTEKSSPVVITAAGSVYFNQSTDLDQVKILIN